MNTDSKQQLIEYGRTLMARVAGGKARSDPPWVAPFLALLGPESSPAASTEPLRSIFTLVEIDGSTAEARYVRPAPLRLAVTGGDPAAWELMPVRLADAASGRPELYAQFVAHGAEVQDDFYRFFHLMRKYASMLPNTYGEPGVSLFEQWKMIAALVGISGSTVQTPQALGLVSGDIPGIQRTINTVTAKGAAKAMRGRSAFIQLLGQVLVERLLDVLDLDQPNVVYDAGGNFVLLTGWDHDTERKVREVEIAVNRVLLGGAGSGHERFDGFHGDLSAALAAVEIPLEALRMPPPTAQASAWQNAEAKVKREVGRAKARPFGDLALADADGWKLLFDPEPSETDDFCAVCRRQRMRDEPDFEPLDDEEGGTPGVVCPECAGFNMLANQMGHTASWLTLTFSPPTRPQAWQRALYEVSGRWYALEKARASGDIVLALSPDDFKAGSDVDGFRTLAHTTPMSGRQIKPNEALAQAGAGGLKRLGVLRMDVDDLGNLIIYGLPRRTAMQTAELSQALERFFAGWLDRICARVDEGEGLFYVLFAGGDDLFVMGPWTLMPALAQAIRADFARYTAERKAIHISAGIAVVGEKSPLYAAAEKSHHALQLAKHSLPGKNAITFLGETWHWDAFAVANELKERLCDLVERDELPTSLLTRLMAIDRRYRQDKAERRILGPRKTPDGHTVHVYFGPWMWRQAYAMARLREGRTPDVRAKLERLEEDLLHPRIEYLGLAARWAQWLTRKEH